MDGIYNHYLMLFSAIIKNSSHKYDQSRGMYSDTTENTE